MTTIRIGLLALTVAAAGLADPRMTLDAMLRNAGYSKLTVGNDGIVKVQTRILNQEWTMDVSLSESHRKIWIMVDLAGFASPNGISFESYQSMMRANREWGPSRFSVAECAVCKPLQRYWLRAERAVDNRGVTTKILTDEIAALIDFVESTQNIWKASRRLRAGM